MPTVADIVIKRGPYFKVYKEIKTLYTKDVVILCVL